MSLSRKAPLAKRLPGHPVVPSVVAGSTLIVAAAIVGGLWYRRKTTPFPYSLRWALDKELPFLTQERLFQVLTPRPGERILEIGPGTGYFSIPIAQRLQPTGKLDIFDIQQVMLEHTLGVAEAQGVTNISATLGDARRLPYPEGTFDAAFMMTVLGEITDQEAVLGELRRVLKVEGRLVIGEFLFDWHAVPLWILKRRAERQGLRFESRLGPSISYIARFSA